MNNDPMVTIEHVRDVNLCARGARVWFARHGLDFREFLMHGLPASVIEGTGDALGKLVADKAREDAEGNR